MLDEWKAEMENCVKQADDEIKVKHGSWRWQMVIIATKQYTQPTEKTSDCVTSTHLRKLSYVLH